MGVLAGLSLLLLLSGIFFLFLRRRSKAKMLKSGVGITGNDERMENLLESSRSGSRQSDESFMQVIRRSS